MIILMINLVDFDKCRLSFQFFLTKTINKMIVALLKVKSLENMTNTNIHCLGLLQLRLTGRMEKYFMF